MRQRLSSCRWALALAAVVLSMAVRSGADFEALQNGAFDSGLAGWQLAQDVSDWPVQQSDNGNPYISLHPGKAFRGPLVYQNLNIAGIGGATVTVSVRLLPLDSFMTCGRSVAVYLDYVTAAGQRREKRLIHPFDCEVFNSGLLAESFTLPADAARITRLSLSRMDMWGQMGADYVVEATGVADPAELGGIAGPSPSAELCRLVLTVCLADAGRFFKVARTLAAARRQAALADIVIVTGSDRASATELAETRAAIAALNGRVLVVEAPFARLPEPVWEMLANVLTGGWAYMADADRMPAGGPLLPSANQGQAPDLERARDKYVTLLVQVDPLSDMAAAATLPALLPAGTERAKGFVQIDGQMKLWQYANGRVEILPAPPNVTAGNFVVVVARR